SARRRRRVGLSERCEEQRRGEPIGQPWDSPKQFVGMHEVCSLFANQRRERPLAGGFPRGRPATSSRVEVTEGSAGPIRGLRIAQQAGLMVKREQDALQLEGELPGVHALIVMSL